MKHAAAAYLAAAMALASLPAVAQEAEPDPAVQQLKIDEAQYLLGERRAQVVAVTRELKAVRERVDALATQADLTAQAVAEMLALSDYLRACGDKPGCTVPVEPASVASGEPPLIVLGDPSAKPN